MRNQSSHSNEDGSVKTYDCQFLWDAELRSHGAILNRIKNWAPNAPISLHPAMHNLVGQYVESAIMAATKDCITLAPDVL